MRGLQTVLPTLIGMTATYIVMLKFMHCAGIFVMFVVVCGGDILHLLKESNFISSKCCVIEVPSSGGDVREVN